MRDYPCFHEDYKPEGNKFNLLPKRLRPIKRLLAEKRSYNAQKLINELPVFIKHYSIHEISYEAEQQIKIEITLLKEFEEHKNINKLVYCIKGKNYVSLIFEQLTGNIMKYYRKFGTELVTDQLKALEEMAQTIHILHDHGFAHCDIKPDDFILDKKDAQASSPGIVLKLNDFITAVPLGKYCFPSRSFYRAPELVAFGRVPSTTKADSWSLALSIAAALAPENTSLLKRYAKKISLRKEAHGELYDRLTTHIFSNLEKVDTGLAETVTGWLKVVPAQRPEALQMAQQLRVLIRELERRRPEPFRDFGPGKKDALRSEGKRRTSICREVEVAGEVDPRRLYCPPGVSRNACRSKLSALCMKQKGIKRRFSQID